MINNDNIFSLEGNDKQPHNFYVYVRLYSAVYKSKLNAASLLDKGIKLIDQKTNTSNGNKIKHFNHATINNNLKDNFLGLTLAPGDKADLRVESISRESTSNNYINSCDHDKSQYSVYAVKCTKEDYNKVCKMLRRQARNDITDYSVKQNVVIATSKIVSNIINLFKHKKQNSHEDFNDLDKNTGAVCSTFVMNVLYHCINKLHNKIDKNHMHINLFTPNDIINKIPDMKFCFGGTFNSYKQDCKNFIESHPEHGELL